MSIPIVNSLLLPHQEDNALLDKTLKGSLRRKGRLRDHPKYDAQLTAWPASLYTLDKSALFQNQSHEMQQQIVQACNNFVMSESYFIEKAGIAYCAKMIALGETTEIRQMYGLIASDEAAHLSWLAPYLTIEQRVSPQGKFVQHISTMIENCEVNTLYFLIQTVLEGWGIAYYKTLAKTCQWDCLKETLLDIVKDEAIHHNTGVALFDPKRIDHQAEKDIYDGIKSYLDILRVGAQNIVACVESELGPLSFSELTALFQAIESQSSSMVKLQIMKKIMQQPATQKWIDVLGEEGYFEPYAPEECARIYKIQRHYPEEVFI
ncbi:MAG: hypothetical protein AB7I18_11410 [Candidatus Berkiella sp.]